MVNNNLLNEIGLGTLDIGYIFIGLIAVIVILLIIIMSNLGKKYTKISILIKVFIKNVQKSIAFLT